MTSYFRRYLCHKKSGMAAVATTVQVVGSSVVGRLLSRADLLCYDDLTSRTTRQTRFMQLIYKSAAQPSQLCSTIFVNVRHWNKTDHMRRICVARTNTDVRSHRNVKPTNVRSLFPGITSTPYATSRYAFQRGQCRPAVAAVSSSTKRTAQTQDVPP